MDNQLPIQGEYDMAHIYTLNILIEMAIRNRRSQGRPRGPRQRGPAHTGYVRYR